MGGTWEFIILIFTLYINIVFLQKSKKTVINRGSAKIRDYKCKIISVHRDYTQLLLPLIFILKEVLGPADWLKKKGKRKRKVDWRKCSVYI